MLIHCKLTWILACVSIFLKIPCWKKRLGKKLQTIPCTYPSPTPTPYEPWGGDLISTLWTSFYQGQARPFLHINSMSISIPTANTKAQASNYGNYATMESHLLTTTVVIVFLQPNKQKIQRSFEDPNFLNIHAGCWFIGACVDPTHSLALICSCVLMNWFWAEYKTRTTIPSSSTHLPSVVRVRVGPSSSIFPGHLQQYPEAVSGFPFKWLVKIQAIPRSGVCALLVLLELVSRQGLRRLEWSAWAAFSVWR